MHLFFFLAFLFAGVLGASWGISRSFAAGEPSFTTSTVPGDPGGLAPELSSSLVLDVKLSLITDTGPEGLGVVSSESSLSFLW